MAGVAGVAKCIWIWLVYGYGSWYSIMALDTSVVVAVVEFW